MFIPVCPIVLCNLYLAKIQISTTTIRYRIVPSPQKNFHINLYIYTLFSIFRILEQPPICSFLYFCPVSNAINKISLSIFFFLYWCLIFSKCSVLGSILFIVYINTQFLLLVSNIWLYECSSLFILHPLTGIWVAFSISQ